MNLPLILILAILATPMPSPPASPTPAPAQTDPCTTGGRTAVLATIDRPTLGFSSCSVAPRDVLLEAGAQFNTGTSPLTHLGQAIWRYGAAPRLEFDALGPDYVNLRAPGSGFADAGAGLKWQFVHGTTSTAAIDLLFTEPTGAAALTAGIPTQTFNLDYGTSFGKFGLGATAAFTRGNPSANAFTTVLTDQFNARTQWFTEGIEQFGASGSNTGADFGLQYLLSDSFEVDAEAGALNGRNGSTRWTGFGFGLRF